jgi:modulator of FtsH protease
VLIIGLLAWAAISIIDVRAWRRAETDYRRLSLLQLALNQFLLAPYTIAGIMILRGDFAGLYWLVPAMLFSFVKAILDSWVLLVEIDR